jgi:uncharacterized membrane protein
LFFGILAIYLIGLGFVCLILLKIFGILDDGNFYIHTFVDSLLYLFTSIVGAMIYNHRSKDI